MFSRIVTKTCVIKNLVQEMFCANSLKASLKFSHVVKVQFTYRKNLVTEFFVTRSCAYLRYFFECE